MSIARRPFRFVLFAAALALLPAVVQAAAQGLTAVPARPLAPEFELRDPDGNIHRMSDYRGRVAIVNFWATWCPPCRAEMPSMQRAWEQIEAEGILMIGINVGEDLGTVNAFTEEYPVTFPLLLDEDAKVTGEWPVRGMPTTFVVDTGGRIVYRAIGEREWDDPDLLDSVRNLQ
jgi:peroxiredoxin